MSTSGSASPPWSLRLDGLDWHSPRAVLEAELARVEASRAPPDLEEHRLLELRRLRHLLKTATVRGGFADPDQPY
jgi:hypothetical protein